MERYFASGKESPLHTLRTLERNLKRERQVSFMVVMLLIVAVICAAAVTLLGRLAVSLRSEAQAVQLWEENFNSDLIERQNVLTTARLLLELRVQGILPSSNFEKHMALGAISDEAVRLVSPTGSSPPLLFIFLDNKAVYNNHLLSIPVPVPPQARRDFDRFVESVFVEMRARGADPVEVGRTRRVVWFRAPASELLNPQLVVGATIVLRDDAPYALVMTALDPETVDRTTVSGDLQRRPALVESRQLPALAGASSDSIRAIDARLAQFQDGQFHYLSGYGWGLRRRPLVLESGHLVYGVPWKEQFQVMRNEVLVVFAASGALILLLLAMFRYWNYQFLTRTYKEASRALESEILNHILVHASPVGLCIVFRQSLKIVVANQIARNLLGLDSDTTYLPEALRNEFEKHSDDEGQVAGPTKVYQFPFSHEIGGGGRIHLEITYSPAVLKREEVLLCTIADISGHVEARQILREAKLTSDAAARAKVSFFASMSHEIRTPLASLVGNIELVALGPLAPEQDARVRAMQTSAMGLLQVVNDVLDFSKIDVGEMRLSQEWASITDTLERVVLAHAPLSVRHKKVKLYVVMERDIPSSLLFDPLRVSQIINNLLGNAFKFTLSGKIVVRARWIDKKLEISVVDSGIGISDDLKPRLFQPFTQGEVHRLAGARGTGLGLSICARLTELMNGHIGLESALGVGTRVTVTLPLAAAGDAVASTAWTLPDPRPAILCNALEYKEWLTNLFDPSISNVTYLSDIHDPVNPADFDYVLVTDEFAAYEVLATWGAPSNVIWLMPDGPLVPVMRGGDGVEVSIYSHSGIKAATQMLRSLPPLSSRGPIEGMRLSPPGRNFGRVTVLIAEDNLLNRGLLCDQLTTLGANVLEATQGDEALALFQKEQVDIVLTDIDMPVMNGYELLKALRALSPSIPVYAISASARPEDIAEGRRRGFSDYLSKPVPLAALAAVLDIATSPDKASRDEPVLEIEPPRFPDVPQRYVEAFVKQTTIDQKSLAAILEARDLARLKKWAHGVSGGLSVLGPSMLLDLSQELRLQMATCEGWNTEIEQLAMILGEELAAVREAEQSREKG